VRWGAGRVGRGGAWAAWAVLGTVGSAVLGVLLVSAWWGWRLAHPPRRMPHGNPATDARLIWRCLPDVVALPPCPTGDRSLRVGDVPLSGWILPVPAAGIRAGSPGAPPVPQEATAWPGTSPSQWSDRTVVFVSDAGQDRLQAGFPVFRVAQRLMDAGYNVVLFDPQGTGRSGGDEVGFGALEAADVEAVVRYLRTLGPPGGQVALWGFGAGADAALAAAAEDRRIGAVVADSPYARLGGYLARNVPRWTGLPRVPFGFTIPWVMGAETGVRWGAFRPLAFAAALGARGCPLLLVVGGGDQVTPPAGVRALYAAAEDRNAALLVVPGAGHLGAFAAAPDRYLAAALAVLGEMG